MYNGTSKRLQVSLTIATMEHSVMAIVEAMEETEGWHGTRPPGHFEQCVQKHIKKFSIMCSRSELHGFVFGKRSRAAPEHNCKLKKGLTRRGGGTAQRRPTQSVEDFGRWRPR